MNTNQAKQKSIAKTVSDLCFASYQKLVAGIEDAKRNLAAQFHGQEAVPDQLVNLALNEAEALAWQSGYPQLVFPALATEKVTAASAWYRRSKALTTGHALAA